MSSELNNSATQRGSQQSPCEERQAKEKKERKPAVNLKNT